MEASPTEFKPEKAKRGYRACLHCRARKAKCDLGDIDSPSSPPCTRCRRESRECVFAPSKRGGNITKRPRGSRRVKDETESEEPESSRYNIEQGGSESESEVSVIREKSVQVHASESGGALGFDALGQGLMGMGKSTGQTHSGGRFQYPPPSIPSRMLPDLAYGEQVLASQQPQSQPQRRNQSQTQQQQQQQQQQQHQQQHLYDQTFTDNRTQQYDHDHNRTDRPGSIRDLLIPSTNHYLSNQSPNQPSVSSTHYSPLTDHSGNAATPYLSNRQNNHNPSHHRTSSTGAGSSPSGKRRRLQVNADSYESDPSNIVVADMQNESDALHILALASGQAGGRREDADPDASKDNSDNERSRGKEGESSFRNGRGREVNSTGRSTGMNSGQLSGGLDAVARRRERGREAYGTAVSHGRKSVKQARIEDFPLIKLGIITSEQVSKLSEAFFHYHHHLFPMIPSSVIPRTPKQLALFALNERYLLTAMIIIASRHNPNEGMREIHDSSWTIMRGWISDITCLGAPPTIGLVEGLLLLAENLPRDPTRKINGKNEEPEEIHALGSGEEVHSNENRQAWMLIGTAIRCAYGLGLDKLAVKLFHEEERTLEFERARLAWTYCYLFDRHVSLRLGKAFWSRGPVALCFQGFSSSQQTGPQAAPGNFPYLREIKASSATSPSMSDSENQIFPQEDFGSLVQAYVELTQMMTNAHDVLYPNASRTRSLAVYGEYFKYIDDLARSLDGFKILWRQKKWTVFPLTDAVWAMFSYVQLYVCAFAFQAHVERASLRAEEEYKLLEERHRASGQPGDPPRPQLSLFPRGAAASPDARFIFHSIDAARELLRICVDSLYPGGALPFLPSRFLLWFTYAAIFLLKALYSGAMLRADHIQTLKLIDRLCICFETSSNDEDHPAVRYGRQLVGLKKKLASLSDATGAISPTGGHNIPLPSSRAGLDRSNTEPSSKYRLAKSRDIVPTTNSASLSNGDQRNGKAPDAATDLPWLDNPSSGLPQASYSADTSWTMPPHPPDNTNPISFLYPSTPDTSTGQNYDTNNSNSNGPFIPLSLQPVAQQSTMDPQEFANLGFTTLDDWFGSVNNIGADLGGPGGGMGMFSNAPVGGSSGFVGTGGLGDSGGIGGEDGDWALDLGDFWQKVGPGEAQGGFPFR